MKRKRYPSLAALATFGLVGLGQLYNGKLAKAAFIYCLSVAGSLLGPIFLITASFSGLLVCLALSVAFFLIVMIDAILDARKLRKFLSIVIIAGTYTLR